MKQTETIRHLHLIGATGKIRTAIYNGSEHLVVPVTMMVEGVVWAVNSKDPELVLADELAVSPQQWNGRACFAGHPAVDGNQVTANTPKVLEQSFGVVFDTLPADKVRTDKRLQCEAYLDPVKAKAVGPEAEDVIRRLQAGETVEVSVGCYVYAEPITGDFNGKKYSGVWRNIVSDHLAFLAKGEQGACSVAAGCGAARTAVSHLVTAEGLVPQNLEIEMPDTKKQSLKDRILSALFPEQRDASTSDLQLRRSLDDALRAIEPGYSGIREVFPDDSQVIYEVAPEDEYLTKRATYSIDANGDVKLGTLEQVEAVVTYQVTTEEADEIEPTVAQTKPCGCGVKAATTDKKEDIPLVTQEEKVMKPEVKALIDASAGKYTDLDATWLDAVPTDRLATLSVKKEEAPKPVSWEDIAPPEAKAIFARAKEADAKHRTELITTLKSAQSVYDEARLLTKSTKELDELAAMLNASVPAANYSGNGVLHNNAGTPDMSYLLNPPDAWAIKKAS